MAGDVADPEDTQWHREILHITPNDLEEAAQLTVTALLPPLFSLS